MFPRLLWYTVSIQTLIRSICDDYSSRALCLFPRLYSPSAHSELSPTHLLLSGSWIVLRLNVSGIVRRFSDLSTSLAEYNEDLIQKFFVKDTSWRKANSLSTPPITSVELVPLIISSESKRSNPSSLSPERAVVLKTVDGFSDSV